jgi:hypothetical protein
MKELLDIATRHTSGEEAVGAIFVQSSGKVIPGGDRGTSTIATDKGTKRGIKMTSGGQDGGPNESRSPLVVRKITMTRMSMTPTRSSLPQLSVILSVRHDCLWITLKSFSR